MNQTLRSRTRVVVTGIGAVTPIGNSADAFFEALTEGRSGIAPFTLIDASAFPCKIGGEVKAFEPPAFLDRKAIRRMPRFAQFMVSSAAEAIQQSGLDFDSEDRNRMGVVIGNGGGGYHEIQDAAETLFTRGGMKLDPLYMAKTLGNMAAAQVALQFGLKGYNGTIVTACAAGTQAIGEAAMVLRAGRADVVITGGCEAAISELGLAGFAVMRALSSRNDDPAAASRPFDAARDGFVPCEGAGALVLETEAHAIARGATFSFADNSLVLAPGATVRVVNQDSQEHSIGSFVIPAGETFDITLPKTGADTELSCSIHPSGYLDLGVEKRPPLLATILPSILLGAPFGLLTALAIFLTGKIDSDPKQPVTA